MKRKYTSKWDLFAFKADFIKSCGEASRFRIYSRKKKEWVYELLPTSQIKPAENLNEIKIPYWLAEDKGLI